MLGRDNEDIFADLEFERGAGFGDVCAGLGEVSFGVHLAFAGIGEGGFQPVEFSEQFRTEFGFVFGGARDEAVKQTGDLAQARFVVFLQSPGEEFGILTAVFGEFVTHSAFTLADGGPEKLKRLVFGNGTAGLSGQERGSSGQGGVESAKCGLRWRHEGRELGRKRGNGFKFADVVFGELAQFFATDFAVGQMIFKESLDVDHCDLVSSDT